jgi:DNA-binding response OmpR family regulator
MEIFVIDDETSIRDILTELLEDEGYIAAEFFYHIWPPRSSIFAAIAKVQPADVWLLATQPGQQQGQIRQE